MEVIKPVPLKPVLVPLSGFLFCSSKSSRGGQPYVDGGPGICFSHKALRTLSRYLGFIRVKRRRAQYEFPPYLNGQQLASNELCRAYFSGHAEDELLGACLVMALGGNSSLEE